MASPVVYSSFAGSAPDAVWRDVSELFVEAFSAPPYSEDPVELGTIKEWGPDQLTHGGGRLVAATCGSRLVGFALGRRLRGDAAWQNILSRLSETAEVAATALAHPEDTWIVQELAVRPSERGRGIAGTCLFTLLADRPESHTFIGVYERATEAASMYRHWQLSDIGQVPVARDAIVLHVLTAPTDHLASRLSVTANATPHTTAGNA